MPFRHTHISLMLCLRPPAVSTMGLLPLVVAVGNIGNNGFSVSLAFAKSGPAFMEIFGGNLGKILVRSHALDDCLLGNP